mgnify:CR=1 FL=1
MILQEALEYLVASLKPETGSLKNWGVLRTKAKELHKLTLDWSLAQVVSLYKHSLEHFSEETLQMTAVFFLMCRYTQLASDLSALNRFKDWIEKGTFSSQTLKRFCEYILLPVINYNTDWRLEMLNWAQNTHFLVRKAAALSIKKYALDCVPFCLEVVSILLGNSPEKEVQEAVGQVLRQVSKKSKAKFLKYLESNLPVITKRTLRIAVGRLPKKQRYEYLHTYKIPKLVGKSNLKNENSG